MTPVAALLAQAAVQHSAFARRQALEFGVTPSMLRTRVARGDWPEVAAHVHSVAGSPPTWLRALSAATLARGGPLYASHGSAARLHGLDGFSDATEVEVLGARGRRPLVPEDVRVHWSRRLNASATTVVDGIATLNLATTLVTIAATSPVPILQRAFDDVVRRGTSLLWLRDTFLHHHHRGSRATTRLLEMLADYQGGRPLPASWFERVTETLLRAPPDVPPLERQWPVRRADGRMAFIDLAVPHLRVGIECQSRAHHAGTANAHHDAVRSRQLDAVEDWDLLPVWWRDLDRVDEVAAAFLAKIDRRRREIAGVAALNALRTLGERPAQLSEAGGVWGLGCLTSAARNSR